MSVVNFLRDWTRRHPLIAVVVLLVGFLGGVLVEENVRGRWALRSYLRYLASKGAPLELETLRLPPVSPESNAFPQVFQAASRLQGSRLARFPPPLFSVVNSNQVAVVFNISEWTASLNSQETTNLNWALMEADMADHADALAALEVAVARTEWSSGADEGMKSGLGSGDGKLRALRVLAVAISTAAITEMNAGRMEAGVRRLESLLKVIRLMEVDSTIGGQSARGVMTRVAFQAQWQALQLRAGTDGQWQALQNAWQELRFSAPMARALAAERIRSLQDYDRAAASPAEANAVFGEWRGWQADSSIQVSSIEDALAVAYERRQELGMRGIWIPLWRVAGLRHDELAFLRSVEQLQQDLCGIADGGAVSETLLLNEWEVTESRGLSGFYRLMSSRRLRSLHNAAARTLSWEVLKDLTTTAIALRRYQMRHGTLPDRLEPVYQEMGLSPTPRDPFTGGPLGYRKLSVARARLYSVGRNQVDEGGDSAPRWPELGRTDLLDGLDVVWPEPAPAQPESRPTDER